MKRQNVQGRSGRVALPRVKVVLAKAARFAAEGALALRAERTAELRKTAVEDMFLSAIVSVEYFENKNQLS